MVAPSPGAVVVVRLPFSDPTAVQLLDTDFPRGSLQRTSYPRPGTLFTARESLMVGEAEALKADALAKVVSAIVGVITQS